MRAPLDTDIAIETPEHVVFRYRVAGPARRLLAYLLDLVVCYGVFAIVATVLLVALVGAGQVVHAAAQAMATAAGLLLILLFAIQWVYFAVLEGWRGATPGKAALGLRVVSTAGRPVSFRAAAIRNLLRAADAFPLTYSAGVLSMAGLAAMAMTRRFQRLGDLVAGTMVIVSERTKATAPIELVPPAQPDELERMPAEVTLDADERLAIEMFLRRRDRLSRGRERELATMIAPLVLARHAAWPIADPSRALALLYDRATNAGGRETPPSLPPESWR